jgi:hypothetical protein
MYFWITGHLGWGGVVYKGGGSLNPMWNKLRIFILRRFILSYIQFLKLGAIFPNVKQLSTFFLTLKPQKLEALNINVQIKIARRALGPPF